MNHRIQPVAAGGAVLAAAFLSAGIAAADNDDDSGTGAALTASFDPAGSDIDYPIDLAPLVQFGSGTGDFTLADSAGNDIGSFTDGDVEVINVVGVDSMRFTFDSGSFSAVVDSSDPGDIESVLDAAGISADDLGGAGLGDAAHALADADGFDAASGDVDAAGVSAALQGGSGGGIGVSGDAAAEIAAALNGADVTQPDDGTSYSVTDFGFGIENIYESVPAGDGGLDTVVTPLGNVEFPTTLSGLFGEGVRVEGGVLGELFNGGGLGDLDSETSIAKLLEIAGVGDDDFTGGDLDDVTTALADSDEVNVAGGDVSAAEVSDVLHSDGIRFADPGEFDAHDLADLLNGDDIDESKTGLGEFIDTISGNGGLLDTIVDTIFGNGG